jgi:tyramine---L-glutamate ligase
MPPDNPNPLRVLVHEVLSAGLALDGLSPAEQADLRAQGQAMRDAVCADLLALPGVAVVAVESDTCPSPPGCVPVRAEPDEPPHHLLSRLAPTVDAVWCIAPETAGLLSDCAKAVAVSPARWLGCRPFAIRIASLKSATRLMLGAAGIAVPAGEDADESSADGAWVVKPDDGAGSTATRRWPSRALARADAAERRARDEPVSVERWVDGPAGSLTLLCAPGQVELLAINRQRIEVGAAGHVQFHGVDLAVEPLDGPRADALAALAARVTTALPGLWGVVGIDFVDTPAGPVVIEVNPRLTSAYVGLSARLGRNLAQAVLDLPAVPR